jgi:hypothetical protein
VEELVVAVGPALAVDDDDPVGPFQVHTERLGSLNHRLLVVGAGQQLLYQVSAHPELGFRGAGQPGELHAEDRGGMLQRHQLEFPGLLVGVEERQDADDVRPG